MLRSCMSSFVRVWKSTQVELQGQYSVERLYRVKAHCDRSGKARTAFVLALTPLPCLLITLAIECIPLADPSLGVAHAFPFFVRIWIVTALVDFLALYQCRHLIPSLPSSSVLLAVLGCIAGAGAILSLYGMAFLIGFPLPFTSVLGSPVSCLMLGISVMLMWGDFFRCHVSERQELYNYIVVVSIQVSMTYVYPAYAFVFVRLPSWWQLLFALLLPVLKRAIKAAIGYFYRDKHDIKADMVVLNADIYHVLFVSWCMNGSQSVCSTLVVVLMDFMTTALAYTQVRGSMSELLAILQSPKRARRRSRSNSVAPSASNVDSDNALTVLDLALAIWEHDEANRQAHPNVQRLSHVHPEMAWQSVAIRERARDTAGSLTTVKVATGKSDPPQTCTRAAVAPLPEDRTAVSMTRMTFEDGRQPVLAALDKRAKDLVASLSGGEREQYLQLVLRLLHTTEFLLLSEFVEMVVPAIYCAYVAAIYYLPNRKYFESVRDLSEAELASRLSRTVVYSLIEVVSFALLAALLQRKLGIAPLRQLAFAIESQWHMAQAKLILWVAFAVQSRLEHVGVDFTFQFRWLSPTP